MTLADYTAQVQALVTSARELESQILSESWQTPEDREAAEVLVIRLALMRRVLEPSTSGEKDGS